MRSLIVILLSSLVMACGMGGAALRYNVPDSEMSYEIELNEDHDGLIVKVCLDEASGDCVEFDLLELLDDVLSEFRQEEGEETEPEVEIFIEEDEPASEDL